MAETLVQLLEGAAARDAGHPAVVMRMGVRSVHYTYAELVQRSLSQPLGCIVANCGRDSAAAVAKVAKAGNGYGFDARTGATVDMIEAGIVDPVKVSYCAVRNAGSVAALILTTQTLIAKRPDDYDPTAGPARGGGAERL